MSTSAIARRYPWQPCEQELPFVLTPTGTVTLKEFSGNCSPDPILNNAQTQKRGGRGGSQNLQRFTLALGPSYSKAN